MKQYKIVKHYLNPTDFLFRIYKRTWLFFWSWECSYDSVERCKHEIASRIEKEQRDRQEVANTPKSQLIGYM